MQHVENRKSRVDIWICRKATLVEAVLAITLISLLFWYIFMVAQLGFIKIIMHHAAFVMGRSHIVGFEHDITYRAMNVGAIPASGILKRPSYEELGIRSQIDLGLIEPYLISQYIQERPVSASSSFGDVMEYQHWNKLTRSTSAQDITERVERFEVSFRINFAKEDYYSGENDYLHVTDTKIPDRHMLSLIPGIWYFIPGGELHIRGRADFLNHAAYYMR